MYVRAGGGSLVHYECYMLRSATYAVTPGGEDPGARRGAAASVWEHRRASAARGRAARHRARPPRAVTWVGGAAARRGGVATGGGGAAERSP